MDPKELNNMNVKGQKKSCHYLLVVQLESPNKIVYNAISFPNNTCFKKSPLPVPAPPAHFPAHFPAPA